MGRTLTHDRIFTNLCQPRITWQSVDIQSIRMWRITHLRYECSADKLTYDKSLDVDRIRNTCGIINMMVFG